MQETKKEAQRGVACRRRDTQGGLKGGKSPMRAEAVSNGEDREADGKNRWIEEGVRGRRHRHRADKRGRWECGEETQHQWEGRSGQASKVRRHVAF